MTEKNYQKSRQLATCVYANLIYKTQKLSRLTTKKEIESKIVGT
jgi:hypothetical protein